MPHTKVASREEWTAARKALLEKEKAFSKERDALSAARRELPWIKVDKTYTFEGTEGKTTLAELFGPRRQLIVYHFMFDPSWTDGCKSCSFIADNFQGGLIHLGARDTAFAVISRAPLEKLQAFKRRMGWDFRWFSSFDSDFNYDYQVSFPPDAKDSGVAGYNYGSSKFPTSEAPGLSVFFREEGEVFHTYSTYSRGLDLQIGTYNYLDLTPLGRNEQDLSYGMEWVRLHDKYQ